MFITDAFIENGKKNTENYNFFGLKWKIHTCIFDIKDTIPLSVIELTQNFKKFYSD